ncbi:MULTISPECIES: choice-of-anchor A family protein [Janthinobacterium]|uniref:Choice-of-anchor A family protein n=1 Tax=Janthinobacterium violaceinigrum TaxID=2654252 RepID=A0A6I1I0Z1_9BURK|nr:MULTISPECIES: choice-of-anchor A family protein [Janthinobacterium]KAB8064584.1 choice-of-anchor A family protein [Janthinobacterium violaceinigrum]MCX7292216.1 choice-of-anchor A family protein [Janthinobacterium sp.]MED5593767.1 choice-of-anchor A family protein [Janthinobacterium sp. P210006]
MKLFSTRTLPLISAALFAFSFSASAQATVIDLGVANGYSAFIFGNIGSSGSSGFTSVGGSLAAGGNIYLDSYSVGTNKKAGSAANTLVAGNSLNIGNGTISGTGVYGVSNANGTVTAPSWYPTGTFSKGNASTLDFAGAKQQLTTLSGDVAKLQSNGTVVSQYGNMTLVGNVNADVNIFNIDASNLHNLTLDLSSLKSTASIIINGTATNITMSGGFDNFGSFADRTLFNFSNATTTNLNNVGINGSILAPNAAFSGSGSMNGTLVANSVSSINYGHVSMNGSGFNTVNVSAVPEPGTYAMLLAGLGLLAFMRRRTPARAPQAAMA